jgi:hypothetical protein
MDLSEYVELDRQRMAKSRDQFAPYLEKLFRDWLKTQGIQLDGWKVEWTRDSELPLPLTANELTVP